MNVIQTCKKENIDFVCLPANSTDNTQPLDVAYFGPLKGVWRKQLTAYSNQDPTGKAVDKTKFPGMLTEVMGVRGCQEAAAVRLQEVRHLSSQQA